MVRRHRFSIFNPESEMCVVESLKALIEQLINDRTLIMATLSQVRNKGETCTKVQIKPVELKGKLHYQFASYIGTKVEHRNVPAELAAEDMTLLFRESYRQGLLCTVEADYQVLISKNSKYPSLPSLQVKRRAGSGTQSPQALCAGGWRTCAISCGAWHNEQRRKSAGQAIR